MPPRRQLPWAIKSGGSKPQVKAPPAKPDYPSDIDDDFFDGTILQSSRRGKQGTNSDNDHHGRPSKYASKKRRERHGERLPSSSPPPIAADLPPPKTELMLTGIDKFDLRDDEWMMVEDELLQTAKLFTQHLHLAEYETLKARMEELKKEAVARPVVANAKPSVEGHFKRKAQDQAEKQKKTLKEVLSVRESNSEDEEEPQGVISGRSTSALPPPGPRKPLQNSKVMSKEIASDRGDDDLDVPKRPLSSVPLPVSSKPAAAQTPFKKPEAIVKSATPANTQRKPIRGQRRNLWDDWDELATNPTQSIPAPSPTVTPRRPSSPTKTFRVFGKQESSSPASSTNTSNLNQTKTATLASSKRSTTTLHSDNLSTSPRTALVKDKADRSAKRKTEDDSTDKKKKKYDDIPTFLF